MQNNTFCVACNFVKWLENMQIHSIPRAIATKLWEKKNYDGNHIESIRSSFYFLHRFRPSYSLTLRSYRPSIIVNFIGQINATAKVFSTFLWILCNKFSHRIHNHIHTHSTMNNCNKLSFYWMQRDLLKQCKWDWSNAIRNNSVGLVGIARVRWHNKCEWHFFCCSNSLLILDYTVSLLCQAVNAVIDFFSTHSYNVTISPFTQIAVPGI